MNEEPYKICLRLSTNEAQKLITNAKACGLTRTAYLRRLLNGYDLKPRPSTELEALRTEIHQIGNNINQIAKRLNESGRAYDTDLAEILEKQKQLWGLANKILMKLSTIQ